MLMMNAVTETQSSHGVGISPNYVRGWSIEEAIREILQNYIDSRNEFDCSGHIGWRNGRATVRDYGEGIKPKHLVMGISEKAKTSIGQFGEGLKLALLVFAREGRDIVVKTRNRKIVPEIKHSKQYQTDVIVLNMECINNEVEGTKIQFECSEEELEIGKSYFMEFMDKKREGFKWMDKMDGISKPGGNIWVHGSKVGEIEDMLFSYHFDDSEAQRLVARDRGIVDSNELQHKIKIKICSTRSVNTMKALFEKLKDDETCWELNNISMYGYIINEDDKPLWKRAITEVFGEDPMLSDTAEHNQRARYKGYDNIISIRNMSWESLIHNLGVPKVSEVLAKEGIHSNTLTRSELNQLEERILSKSIEIVSDYYHDVRGKVRIVEEFYNKPQMQGACYKGKIYIKRDRLNTLANTVNTILHEAVHDKTGYDDCSAEIEQEWNDLAAKLLLNQLDNNTERGW